MALLRIREVPSKEKKLISISIPKIKFIENGVRKNGEGVHREKRKWERGKRSHLESVEDEIIAPAKTL